MFELRTDDNPQAMPNGTGTISRHRTLAAATRSARDEHRRFHRSVYATGGGYLQRVIVELDSTGSVVERHPASRWELEREED